MRKIILLLVVVLFLSCALPVEDYIENIDNSDDVILTNIDSDIPEVPEIEKVADNNYIDVKVLYKRLVIITYVVNGKEIKKVTSVSNEVEVLDSSIEYKKIGNKFYISFVTKEKMYDRLKTLKLLVFDTNKNIWIDNDVLKEGYDLELQNNGATMEILNGVPCFAFYNLKDNTIKYGYFNGVWKAQILQRLSVSVESLRLKPAYYKGNIYYFNKGNYLVEVSNLAYSSGDREIHNIILKSSDASILEIVKKSIDN